MEMIGRDKTNNIGCLYFLSQSYYTCARLADMIFKKEGGTEKSSHFPYICMKTICRQHESEGFIMNVKVFQ